ncbi:MAG: hypothetical protein R2882_12350 [Gemmatimonadales bacterium]
MILEQVGDSITASHRSVPVSGGGFEGSAGLSRRAEAPERLRPGRLGRQAGGLQLLGPKLEVQGDLFIDLGGPRPPAQGEAEQAANAGPDQ